MSKLKVLDKKSEKSINSERELLSKLHNPFIVNMHYAFQDSENLYLVMDLMPGGDLRFHISRHKKFSEEQTRFFICGITIALEYIHSNNVIHRDIKPENLVLDENGYVRLTDFGIAKENMPDNKSETSGTPGYMSPEVMKALNHSFPVDFFALGVIGYEFMKGERPYVGKNRKEIKEQILAKQVELKTEDICEGWSKESADCINKLLIRKPENRIGYKGVNELKLHPWLKYYPWEMLYKKTLPSPFIPENKDNFDRRYCESSDVITEETKLRYEEILMDDIYKSAFKKFYYNTDEDKKRKNNNKIKHKEKDKEKDKNNSEINNTSYNKIIINQSHKTIKDINNLNNIEKIKSGNKNNDLKNSMKIIPSSATRNLIIKNDKKFGSVINYNNHVNSNILNSNPNTNTNTNIGGNVSNNVIYINFNINNPNIGSNIYNNNNQHVSPKTDRIVKQYKNSVKNIYCPGNNINNMSNVSNNNSLINKIGINIGNFVSPINSVKKIKNNHNSGSGNKKMFNNNRKNYIQNKYKKNIINNSNNEHNKNNIVKNNKNIHNSMKDIYELKNKTTVIDTKELKENKNLKKSEIISKRENTTSLNKSNNEIKIKKKEISHSNIFKDILIKEDKKEKEMQNNHSLNKENSNSNININMNNSQKNKPNININHYAKKKIFLKYNSPKDEKKNNINNINNSSSINNIDLEKIKMVHLSSSFILLNHPHIKEENTFRVGTIIYGYDVSLVPYSNNFKDKARLIRDNFLIRKNNISPVIRNTKIDLKPALKLKTNVMSIREVKKGDLLGYGESTVMEDMKVAILPVGYEDGIGTNNSGRYVLINNKKYEAVGPICMCMMFVKVDNDVKVGDTVTLLGDDLTLGYLSRLNNTGIQETLVSLGQRLKRVYIKNNKIDKEL